MYFKNLFSDIIILKQFHETQKIRTFLYFSFKMEYINFFWKRVYKKNSYALQVLS